MTRHRGKYMSLKDAVALVPDDLSDGAFWAMAHDLAGAEYGEVWDELDKAPKNYGPYGKKYERTIKCPQCNKLFGHQVHLDRHLKDRRRNGTHQ